MVTLEKLDDKIENLIDTREEMSTYRKLLKISIGNLPPKSADEMLELNQVLMKLKMVEADIQFENHEIKTVIDKVSENKVGLPQISIGQLLAYLKACEKAANEKK